MGLPMSITGSYVFYNKDLLDAAGVPYPPTSWDDRAWTVDAFLERCKTMTRASADVKNKSYGCSLDLWPNDAYSWLFGQNLYPESAYRTGFASTSYLDQDLAIQGFQLRQDLVTKLHYQPAPSDVEIFGTEDLFKSQKVAILVTGGWGWRDFMDIHNFRWAAAALPWGSAGRRDVLFTDPWLMARQSAHPEETWTFMKYLASQEVQRSWMDLTRTPPARKSLLADWAGKFSELPPQQVLDVHNGALKYGFETPTHLLVQFDRLDRILNSALDIAARNHQPVSEIIPSAKNSLDAALKEIQAESAK
jgi:multiple sugar transport system substrate-binding protein